MFVIQKVVLKTMFVYFTQFSQKQLEIKLPLRDQTIWRYYLDILKLEKFLRKFWISVWWAYEKNNDWREKVTYIFEKTFKMKVSRLKRRFFHYLNLKVLHIIVDCSLNSISVSWIILLQQIHKEVWQNLQKQDEYFFLSAVGDPLLLS